MTSDLVISRARGMHVIRAIAIAIVAIMTFAFGAITTEPAYAADLTVEQWRTVEIELTSTSSYSDPFGDVEVYATFTGPDSTSIVRPAFWDGGSTWRVRFAPTKVGNWTMTTESSVPSDTGLQGVTKSIDAVAYAGDLDVYEHGFVRPSPDGRYFTYADGTPFFYLGDTHWIMPHERFSTSNVAGVASQFKFTVDRRVDQGFTVYQSEPIWQPHGSASHSAPDEEPVADLQDGLTASDLAGFANLDAKYEYIADSGLVHAAALVSWVQQPLSNPSVMTPSFMYDVGRYWVARYGSYPVMWTIAQEIDNDYYGEYDSTSIAAWKAVGNAIADSDAYHSVVMPHLEDALETTASNSSWENESYHTGWAAQWQQVKGNDFTVPKSFWNYTPAKPTVLYEAPYEDFWTQQPEDALISGYQAFQLGMYGYGYGVAGVWNDVYTSSDAGTEYGLDEHPQTWYEGAMSPVAEKFKFMKDFYEENEWWTLAPRFDDPSWSSLASGGALASHNSDRYVALFSGATTDTGQLKQLDTSYYYSAHWFNPLDGTSTAFTNPISSADGTWTIPLKPSADPWVLVVDKSTLIGSAAVAPVASPSGTSFTAQIPVVLSTFTSGATIHYTLDGSTPTTTSAVYTGSLNLAGTATVTLKAIAVKSGLSSSPAITETYVPAASLTAGGTFSSSSQWDSTQVAAKAFDSDATTNWQACEGCWANEWLRVDFSAAKAVNTITVSEFEHRTTSYKVQYLVGSTWTDAASGSGLGDSRAPRVIRFPQVTTTAIRILFLSGTSSAPIIYELGAFDVPPQNIAIGGTYSASSQWDAAQSAGNAFDGVASSDWQACDLCWSGQWLGVDFGRSRTFDTVRVTEFDQRTTGYTVQYYSGGSWHDAYLGSGFGAATAPALISFPAVTGTAARILWTSGSGNAPIVYEFEVYEV